MTRKILRKMRVDDEVREHPPTQAPGCRDRSSNSTSVAIAQVEVVIVPSAKALSADSAKA
jgi:hypothetical protein